MVKVTTRRPKTTRREAIGKVLRARIGELGLTQAEVSRRSGFTYQAVNAILQGAGNSVHVSARVAVILAAAVGWSAEELLAAVGDAETPAEVLAELPVETAAEVAACRGDSIAAVCGLAGVGLWDPEDNEGADRRRHPELRDRPPVAPARK
jgi:transcriptional regulator with XRE-family HTH domain